MKKINLLVAIFCCTSVMWYIVSCANKPKQSNQITTFSGSYVEPGQPVADLASYRIPYYEPADNNTFSGSNIQESDAPLIIADYGPRDILPKEISKPSIYVVFSQPVVPLAKLGDPIREGAGLFSIEPSLTGVYRWYGSKLLSFEPDAESLPQQRYTITVSDQIKSLGGKDLQGERSFNFETARLSVLEWQLGQENRWVWNKNVFPEDAKYIRIIFSYPVNLTEIAQWIEVRAAGRTWPFTLGRLPEIDEKRFRKEQGVLVNIIEKLPLDTDVVMELKKGARSEPGWLGSIESKTWTYHTLLPFRYENLSVRSYSRARTADGDSIPISISFSQNVESNETEKYFSVEGLPALKKENVNVYGTTVVINRLPLEYQKNYYVRISAELKDLYGRALGKAERVEAKIGEASSYVYIHNQGSHMLEAGFPPKVVWEMQNPVSLQNRIAAASSPYERLPLTSLVNIDTAKYSPNSKHYIVEDLSPFLNTAGKGTAALRWEYKTKSSWDNGRIESSDSWLNVQVTNIGITVRYAYNMALVWATHLSDGTAVVNADVELLEGERVIVRSKTDSQGLAVFEFPKGNFISRFTDPEGNYWRNDNFNKGLRVRVSEGSGNSLDKAEFAPNSSHNIWRFSIDATSNPFTVEQERPVIFLFTDRGLYRPGETVTFRGIDRIQRLGNYEAYQGSYKIEVSATRYRAPVITSLEGNTTVNGGSYGSFTLPANTEPGNYQIVYRRGSATTIISFTVANFERLRFETSVRFLDPVVYLGEKLATSLSANYLAGGGLSGAPYTWYLTRESANFLPGGEKGVWRNWHFGPEPDGGRSFVSRGEGSLGPDGKASISNETCNEGIEGAVYRYQLEASVQDAARQEISNRADIMVHPASFYIAARLDSGTLKNATSFGNASATGGSTANNAFAAANPSAFFLGAGNPATLSWALVAPNGNDPENNAIPENGVLSIQLVRHEWKQARQAGVGGRINLVWERVEEIAEQHTVTIKAAKAGEFISGLLHFTPGKSGLWEIRLQSSDQKQRTAATRFRFYVSGAGWVRWGSDDIDAINLTTDRQTYRPGETAKILVRSPLEKGKYLLTIEREGIISKRFIDLEGSALTIDIPIEESYIPIVYATLSSYTVRSGPPQHNYYEPDLDKPKGIFGVTPIYIDYESRLYQIEIQPKKNTYLPAEEAEVTLKVSLNGKAVPNAELSFMAVDRGIVDLIDYHVPDPTEFFYNASNFPLGTRGADSRSLLLDPVTYTISDLQGGDGDDDSKLIAREASLSWSGVGFNPEEADMAVRKDFRPTAVFEPFIVTSADGTATVKFRLPDSLTTYRCTAVAVGLDNFGIKEYDLRVSAPLTAIPALPRKLRWRDTGTVSLILTNLENHTVEANVSLTASTVGPRLSTPTQTEGILLNTVIEVDGENSKTVKIHPGTSEEVMFKVAALGVGESQLTFTLRSPQVNERIIKTISVDRPNLTETVTTIGNLGDNNFIEEGMILPSLVPEGTGNITVSLSSSRLATLKEAVRYLLDYPYGCIEQRVSRLLPIIAFGNYLETFNIESPFLEKALKNGNTANIQKIVEEELVELARLQLNNGSFPYWPGESRGNIFVSLRVAHIAALAKSKGMKVPDTLDTRRLLSYIVSTAVESNTIVSKDPFLKGYSLWIRAMYGERIGTEISAFLKQGDELGISGWAFAGLAALELGQKDLAISTRDRVRRYIRPGTRSLDLTDTYERRGNYWGYDADRYALALMLFHALSPEDDMTSRLATSLIERQRRGVWNNTASSFWAVLAFGAVGDSESSEWKGSITTSVSLGGTSLFNAEFKTYGNIPVSYNSTFTEKPVSGLPRDTLLPLRIERTGSSRIYYTASLRYGIPLELAGARDEGLGVFVETFDSDGLLVKDGKLKPGKTYTRRITISSSRDRTHVALRAPIPSGAEILDAVFVTSSTVPPAEENENAAIRDYFYQPQPVRFIMDDEARFHWNFLKAGRQQVEFRFRAVIPGIYPTPPTSAECMYEEEIFGRSAGELIRIE